MDIENGQVANNNQMNAKKIGDYVVLLENQLGKGKFGKVFLAQCKNTQNNQAQYYAVKIIEKAAISSPYLTNAIIRQVKIMSKLKSPHIIAFKEIKQTRNHIYIFQQLAQNGTLQTFLKSKPDCRLQQGEAVQCLRQILEGLQQLIKNGIIHRDLKPGNILLKDQTLKIADFGLSSQNNMVALKTVVGSPLYMAPQLLINNSYSKYSYKCDIWSFGVICYQIITGTIPWFSNKVIQNKSQLLELIQNQIQIGLVYPINIQISQDYKDLIAGCLKFNQQQRYDWQQIYSHKLFQSCFQPINKEMQQQNYILTDLRMKVHSQNINLSNFLSLMTQFNLQDFVNIIRALDQQISQAQAQNLFKTFAKESNVISREDFLDQFKNNHIEVEVIKGKQFIQSEQNKKINSVIKHLRKKILEQNIDVYQIFKDFNLKYESKLNLQFFGKLIKKFQKKIKDQQIECLFNHFNQQGLQCLKLQQLYQQFCRAVQIPALKDESISQSINTLRKKNKK